MIFSFENDLSAEATVTGSAKNNRSAIATSAKPDDKEVFSTISWGHRSEKVKLSGLDYVTCKMCQCAVLQKDKIIIRNVFGNYWHFVEMVEHLSNAIHWHAIHACLDEEQLQFLTWRPSISIIPVTLGPLYRYGPLGPPALPGLPMASYATAPS